MKVVLSVKNTSKVIKPTENSVILYDGEQWYVTTKEKLFKEWTDLLEQSKQKIQELEAKNTEFKREVGVQLKQMSDLIETLFTNGGEN